MSQAHNEPVRKYTNDNGYVCVWKPDHIHHNYGYVLEHRLMVEAQIGRVLDTSEVVHHINEIKTDNRIKNLYLCTQEEHVKIHNRGKVKSQEKKNNIRKGVREARQRQSRGATSNK